MVRSNLSIARGMLPICLYSAPRLYCVLASSGTKRSICVNWSIAFSTSPAFLYSTPKLK